MKWEILIPHIPHRHAQLLRLLDALEPQMRRGVAVVIYSDNLEVGYGDKCQALLQASSAEYVSWLSNDDGVAPDFVPAILEALEQKPDYVGFRVRYTEDGVPQLPVYHSLRYPGWFSTGTGIYRDLMHYNPIRRDLALMVRFSHEDPYLADRIWANDLRNLGCVKSEVFIDREMHYYQHSNGDHFITARQPYPEPLPVLPEYPFVRYIDA